MQWRLDWLVCWIFGNGALADRTRGLGTPRRHVQTTNDEPSFDLSLVASETGDRISLLRPNRLEIISIDDEENLFVNIVAETKQQEINFVRFRLTNDVTGNVTEAREGKAPFAFCGDKGGSFRPCGDGVIERNSEYTMEVFVDGASSWETFKFRIGAPSASLAPAVAPSASGKLARFQLVDANTNEVLNHDLMDGTVLTAKEGDAWNIETVPLHEEVVFVKFSNGHKEGRRPYSLCGDRAGVFDACEDLTKTGDHSFSVTLIAEGNVRIARVYLDIRTVGTDLIERPSGVIGAIPSGNWRVLDNDAPITARHEACFVWVGEKAYLIGGRRMPTTDIYDPATNTWSNAGALPPKPLHHMQCVVVQNEIWIVSAWTGSYPRDKTLDEMYVNCSQVVENENSPAHLF